MRHFVGSKALDRVREFLISEGRRCSARGLLSSDDVIGGFESIRSVVNYKEHVVLKPCDGRH